jgi:hypothetical protein
MLKAVDPSGQSPVQLGRRPFGSDRQLGVEEMIQHGILAVAACACAFGSTAIADMTIDVGRFSNINPVPSYSYVGDWAEYVSSSEVDGRTVFDIDVTGIMSNEGDQYLRSISIRDFGNNSYGILSPGADIDYVEFVGLPDSVGTRAEYSGPTVDHLEESSEQLLARIADLDAFAGANHRDDDVYVSLGRYGVLDMMFVGGGEDGSGGGGGGIDPNGNGGLAGGSFILRIAEAGSYERFTVHLETSDVPAPAIAPVLAGVFAGWRRRRR